MQDHAWQSDTTRVILVVVNFVEIALGPGVLDQLAGSRVLDQLRQLEARLQIHRRIAVPRSLATVRPCRLKYSVSKMMNSRLPVEPVFSYTSTTLPMAVISSPTLTGSMYSNRLPPFSQPLPYSSASGRCAVTGASATRNVGGASNSHRGYESPIASANRLRWPASTTTVVGGPGVPMRARSLSTTEGVGRFMCDSEAIKTGMLR